jgi:hypothetical protein
MSPSPSRFHQDLQALKSKLAEAAQKVYDEWEQDAEGVDEEVGIGGICDLICTSVGSVISEEIADVAILPGGQEGDDHAYVVAQKNGEAFGVDIPAGVYESGGGYNWRKKPGVKFRSDYVVIFPVPTWDEV